MKYFFDICGVATELSGWKSLRSMPHHISEFTTSSKKTDAIVEIVYNRHFTIKNYHEIYNDEKICVFKKNNFLVFRWIEDSRNNAFFSSIFIDINKNSCQMNISYSDEYELNNIPHPIESTQFQIFFIILLQEKFNGIMIHSSSVIMNGKGVIFTGHSGAGKTTVANLMKYEKDVTVLTDETSIVRIIDDKPILFGSPWKGIGKNKFYSYKKIKLDYIFLSIMERQISFANTIK